MKLAQLTHGQKRLLDRYSEIGGVVDFVVIECDSTDEDPQHPSTHHSGVLFAMRELQRRDIEYAERTAIAPNIPQHHFFDVQIDEAAGATIVPRQVSWQRFLGTRYDFERRGLIVRGKGKMLNDFFFYTDAARTANIYPPYRIDNGIGTGFAYAFSAPPYGVGIPAEAVGELFEKVLRFVLCGSATSLICEWPTEWTNYFDAGKEWWGSFLWSLSNPGNNRIIVMAVSTTD